jgi:hypothetical protein
MWQSLVLLFWSPTTSGDRIDYMIVMKEKENDSNENHLGALEV